MGIAPVHQREIFREFYKVPSHAGTEDGFGLGLYIVSRLAGILGHPLSLASRPGRGTVFRLMLRPTDAQRRGGPRRRGFDSAGEHPVSAGVVDRLRAALDAQAAEQPPQVHLDGVLADAQLVGDLAV